MTTAGLSVSKVSSQARLRLESNSEREKRIRMLTRIYRTLKVVRMNLFAGQE